MTNVKRLVEKESEGGRGTKGLIEIWRDLYRQTKSVCKESKRETEPKVRTD